MIQHTSTCPLDCADACSVLVETDERGGFRRLRGNPNHAHTGGVLCGKTALYGDLVTSSERLTQPLLRDAAGELRPASWDEALDQIAERMDGIDGADVLSLEYAGHMGLIARKFPVRVMNALGADLHDGGVCDNTGTEGYELVYGSPVGPDIEDMPGADALVIWGADIKRTLQHAQKYVRELCRDGRPVFAIDVYRTETLQAVERWGGRALVVKPGSDGALALALTRLAYERDRVDRDFIARECLGGDRFEEHVRSGAAPSLEEAAERTGLEPRDIEALGTALSRASRPFVKVGVGWTRRRNGGANMRAVLSLAAVLGIARRVHFESVGVFALDADLVSRPDLRPPGTERPPVAQIELGRVLCEGRYRACFVWGHNPAVTLPDSNAMKRGLGREDLFLVVHEQFLTETAVLADVVLPAATFVEEADLFRSYGHRHLQPAQKACEPPGEARANVEAFAAIARRLGLPRECWDVTAEGLREEVIERSTCLSDEQRERLRAGESVKLPAPEGWSTPSGRIELFSERAVALGAPAMASVEDDDGAGLEGEFQLICAPSRATHNSTFSHSSRHVKRAGAPVVCMDPAQAGERDLEDGTRVRLENAVGRLTLAVRLDDSVPRGLLRIDGLPRGSDFPEGVGVNALVPGRTSDLGNGNVLYSTRVDLFRS